MKILFAGIISLMTIFLNPIISNAEFVDIGGTTAGPTHYHPPLSDGTPCVETCVKTTHIWVDLATGAFGGSSVEYTSVVDCTGALVFHATYTGNYVGNVCVSFTLTSCDSNPNETIDGVDGCSFASNPSTLADIMSTYNSYLN